MSRCKGGTTPDPPDPPDPPPPAVQVHVQARFYNHTQGFLGEREYSGLSDSPLHVKIGDCPDVSTVDPNRFSVREAANGGWLGKLIEFSTTGQLVSSTFPRQDMTYDVFLLNGSNGADYSLIDGNGGFWHSDPKMTWDREDWNATGPDWIPREAMRQVIESMIFPWAKYIEFTELPPYQRGDFYVGYLAFEDQAASYRGTWSEASAAVNPFVCVDDVMKLRVFVEMIIGHLVAKYGFAYASIPPPAYEYLTDVRGITPLGRDILACSIVKDRQFMK